MTFNVISMDSYIKGHGDKYSGKMNRIGQRIVSMLHKTIGIGAPGRLPSIKLCLA